MAFLGISLQVYFALAELGGIIYQRVYGKYGVFFALLRPRE
jgi:hypothetical protein